MKRYTITVNGTPYDVTVQESGAGAPPVAAAPAPAAAPAAPAPAAAPAAPAAPAAAAGSIPVTAPMPGNVLDIKVAAGQAVKDGDVLVILEAMKMENEIVAPQDGTVASINVAKGDTVNVGDVFLTLN
ncbi:MAG: biotin/lipoyl-binding protein [Ruminococcaceae bacterium]|nr:biotin/lipoyl-binding protein [Oscillospiraceae bacterium]